MPILKPVLCAAAIALTIPLSASAQPAPPNEPPAASAPDGRRYDNPDEPRWRGREFRRDRSDDEGRERWRDRRRFGRDDGDRDWRGERFGGERFGDPRGRDGSGRDLAERGLMRPFGMGHFCGPESGRVGEMMITRLERATQPTAEQRPAFEKLKEAATKAGEQLRASCTTERSVTPTGRLAAAEKRLAAMLEAVRTLRPAMDAYYGTLSDEQKARLTLSQPRFGGERWHRRGREDRSPINL